MTEQEYMDAADLARVRDMQAITRNMAGRHGGIGEALYSLEETLQARVSAALGAEPDEAGCMGCGGDVEHPAQALCSACAGVEKEAT